MSSGRPTKYKEEYDQQAKILCEKGFTDKDLADFFGVTETTINNWKNSYPSFFESIKEAKAFSDQEVEKALYKRAIGYEFEEHKEELSEQGKKLTVTKKQLAGDTTAQIFWLKNRQPDRWRDKQHVEANVSVNKADESDW